MTKNNELKPELTDCYRHLRLWSSERPTSRDHDHHHRGSCEASPHAEVAGQVAIGGIPEELATDQGTLLEDDVTSLKVAGGKKTLALWSISGANPSAHTFSMQYITK